MFNQSFGKTLSWTLSFVFFWSGLLECYEEGNCNKFGNEILYPRTFLLLDYMKILISLFRNNVWTSTQQLTHFHFKILWLSRLSHKFCVWWLFQDIFRTLSTSHGSLALISLKKLQHLACIIDLTMPNENFWDFFFVKREGFRNYGEGRHNTVTCLLVSSYNVNISKFIAVSLK